MPRSPSPTGSRGSGGRGGYYNRDQRDRFRDRPFQPNRAHPDDRDGWNRNEGRTWGNYRNRRDEYDDYRGGGGGGGGGGGRGESSRGPGGGGYYDDRDRRDGGYGRGGSRSRSRSRGPPGPRDGPVGYSSGSGSRIPSPSKSRRSSATPEEGQITSPTRPSIAPSRSPLPYRSPAPRRSVSPPRRYQDRDRDFDRRPPPRDYRDHGRDSGYSSRRSRSPSSSSTRSRSRISSPEKSRPRSPPRRSPPPPEVRRPEISQRPPWEDRKAGIHRPPPTGPRGDRAPPTGPRALSGNVPLPRIPPPVNSAVKAEAPLSPPREYVPPPVTSAAPVVNPYDPSLAANQTPAGPRLSWSERKKASPVDVKPVINPYGGRPMAPLSGDASPSRRPHTPMDVDSPAAVSPSPFHRMAPAPVQVQVQVKSEEELAEIRAKEEEARILAELPELKVPFGGGKWESELAGHYSNMQALEQTTLRAQSNMRLHLAILVDAEIEYTAAGERRKVASAQHQLAIDQGMGILGT